MLKLPLSRSVFTGAVIMNRIYESNVSRSLEFVELIITSGTYKVCDSTPCIMRPAMLLFLSRRAPRLYNSQTQMYYAQYNQMTDFETEYVFCKDNRLVLIGECLFAKASTDNAGA